MNPGNATGTVHRLFSIILLSSLLLSITGLLQVTDARAQGMETGDHVVGVDLTITAINVQFTPAYVNEDVSILVDVTNTSDTAAPAFWIDFYIDDVPTGCGDLGPDSSLSSGLAAHTTDTWVFQIPADSLPVGTHQISVFVDSRCEIAETNEANNVSTPVSFTLLDVPLPPPENDNFDVASLISARPYVQFLDVRGATRSADDPALPDCGGAGLDQGTVSVWYKHTPSVSFTYYLDTLGSDYDTFIAVWTGTRGNLTPVACNDDLDASVVQSQVEVNLTAGTTYYFEVVGKGGVVVSPPAQVGGNLQFHVTSFQDVPGTQMFWRYIEGFYRQGITNGCGLGPRIFCPDSDVTRAEMAVFILRARHGASYIPPPPSGIFSDVPVAGKEWMQPWIEQLYREGITMGCNPSPRMFCPEANVTRAEMAVLILRAVHVPGWQPPASTGIFTDVPVAGKEWMQPWVEQFYRQGITVGCNLDPFSYCPENNVTRQEMAVFISRAYAIPQLP